MPQYNADAFDRSAPSDREELGEIADALLEAYRLAKDSGGIVLSELIGKALIYVGHQIAKPDEQVK